MGKKGSQKSMENVVGIIPEFTSPESERGIKEAKEATTEEVVEEEKETPAEPPAVEKPAEINAEIGADTGELTKQVQGLQTEREKLLKEIQDLRGTRREIKQVELGKVEEKLDELKDLHPDDIKVIEKILRAKGYITKDEASKMTYDNVKQEELDKFLVKYPEYKPENDKNDINWNALQRELGYYRMPTDPHRIEEILERAHKTIQKVSSGQDITEKKQKIQTAGVGAGGIQGPSSIKKSLSPRAKEELSRGGWSDEDIKKIEGRLE